MAEEGSSAVVLHFRGGRTLRCTLLHGFSADADELSVATADGESLVVPVSELKAVFFLKDPRRRQLEMQLGTAAESAPEGALARVEFFDGEIVRGLVQHYSVADRGFFLYPTAVESNNDRIFVVAMALTSVDIDA